MSQDHLADLQTIQTHSQGTLTATCADCDHGWRGAQAFDHGTAHEKQSGHVVWYDEDPDEPAPGKDWAGKVIWQEESR